ncbi:unnamed protein product [Lymnaea stagnalis]|uniref:SOWAHA-C winged helix-turn-helix domain-containing protein n=1 Tax=Lymnaea stagnalis TaxID=6523 RepID=A0AAV2I6S2_LYMST
MGDFEIDAVLQFMLSKGGRVRNHELVTHFKNVLNHPINKALNREKFKDYVNELSTIKLDLGEKVLVLKKKYRPVSGDFEFSSNSLTSSSSTSLSLSGSSSSSYMKNTVTPKPAASEPNLTPAKMTTESTSKSSQKENIPAQNDSPRAQSEPPAAHHDEKKEALNDSVDGPMVSKMRSDEHMEVKLRNTDRVSANSNKFEDSVSVSGSNASLASTRSVTSSTSGVASMDDDPNASTISVMDKIKKLNKIHSEGELHNPQIANKKSHKFIKVGLSDNLENNGSMSESTHIPLTPEQKDWMVVSSSSEYHEMNRLLSKNPHLAKLRVSHFYKTALHWAAKSGKAEVIKLIANKPGVKVDQRSGYTPLHLAAIHGHEHIIELLVQTFKADPNLRDYSGKKAKQYLKSSASSKAQPEGQSLYLWSRRKSFHELLVTRRPCSEIHLEDSFLRTSTRMSSRAKAVSTLLFFKSESAQQLLRSSWNGSSDSEEYKNRTPTGSRESSPSSGRKKKVSSHEMNLMPPPANAMKNRRMRRQDRSKSSSRESLNSEKSGNKSDLNQNIMRAGSDSNLPSKTSTIV